MRVATYAIAFLLTAVTACAPAPPAKPSPEVTRGNAPEAQALWSRSITGGAQNASIYRGVVVFGISLRPFGGVSTEALELRTGRILWERNGVLPLSGSPSFLAAGESVEHVDTHSGRVIWRTEPLCSGPYAWMHSPTYAATIESSAYIGCTGGKIVRLRLSDGHVLASAHPAYLDGYDQIVSLGRDALGIGGWADGAYLHRQSAIVKRDTLSAIVILGPDQHILGEWKRDALIENACCQGAHSDSWPADIALVSLKSGETIGAVSLHPYVHRLPPDRDLPGPGALLAVRNILYVGTHTALFAYDLENLNRRPRTLYADLTNLPMILDDRYFTIEKQEPGGVRNSEVLDAYDGMRVIHNGPAPTPGPMYVKGSTRRFFLFIDGNARSAIIDASCALSAGNEDYVFMLCNNVDIASHAHLGGPPKSITLKGSGTMLPQSIATYTLNPPQR